ncbi:MAG TPA: metal-sensitive transcriptional regulator [Acidimicrobiia bacterium]|nr:metal-sensitive transcriptional regulator [Acidimicrobiia bacterium]
MDLPTEDRDEIIKRLRRVEGQIRGIQAMIDDGRDCNEVLTQFAAAHKAMSKAGFRFFAATMEQCRLHPELADEKGYTSERMEQMFLRLS